MAPETSLLFLNTSRLAPDSRWPGQLVLMSHDMATHLLEQQPCKLVPAIAYSLAVGGIDHPDERVGLLEIVLPVRTQRLLAADVP